MNHEEFLVAIGEVLETDSPLTGPEELSSFGSWDSISVITFMAMADEKWGITLAPTDIKACNTVDDLAALLR
jgi:acyl carrier protein